MNVWLVEVLYGDHWVPMYQPCYTREEAKVKADLKRSRLSRNTRVCKYCRVEEP